jgi:hypothetical protein
MKEEMSSSDPTVPNFEPSNITNTSTIATTTNEPLVIQPKRGLEALEDLYAPFSNNITVQLGKYAFRAHKEYLLRSPRLASLPNILSTPILTLTDLPVPSKFMDCLTYLYVGGGQEELVKFHEGLFTPSNFLDTLRNATYLELTEIIDECHQRCAFMPVV